MNEELYIGIMSIITMSLLMVWCVFIVIDEILKRKNQAEWLKEQKNADVIIAINEYKNIKGIGNKRKTK